MKLVAYVVISCTNKQRAPRLPVNPPLAYVGTTTHICQSLEHAIKESSCLVFMWGVLVVRVDVMPGGWVARGRREEGRE
jgi:hypothetical protein